MVKDKIREMEGKNGGEMERNKVGGKEKRGR